MAASERTGGWQVSALIGEIAGRGLADWFRSGFVPADDSESREANGGLLTPERLRPYLDPNCPGWLILPAAEHQRREQWLAAFTDQLVEIGFGRAGLALAVRAVDRAGVAAQILAADLEPELQVLAMVLSPGSGPSVHFSALDGRLEGTNDLATLLTNAQAAVPEIEVLVCPGTPQECGFERIMPFLAGLSRWNRPALRWEFPELVLDAPGVLGALWGLYWLLDGYRVGDWQQPGALLLLDAVSPLAGVIAVSCSETSMAGAAPRPAIKSLEQYRTERARISS